MSEDYSSDWDARRREVYKRDDYTCQNCGAQGGPNGDAELHAHHIVPKSKGGTHKKTNLKTVCKECHDAIHGSSMAPSVDIEKNATQLEFPLDFDRFPLSITKKAVCLNKTKEIYDDLNHLADKLDELDEYSDMYASISGDTPKRLNDRYVGTKQDVEETVSSIQRTTDDLIAISESGFEEDIDNQLIDTISILGHLIEYLEEYLESIHTIAQDADVTESHYYDFRLLKKDISDSVERLNDSTESLQNSLTDEIIDEIKRLDRTSSGFSAGSSSFDSCPICGGEISEKRFSNDEMGFETIRCESCETEWIYSGMDGLKVIHSEYAIEGTTLIPLVWEKIRSHNDGVPNDMDPYLRMSSEYTKKKNHSNILLLVIGVAGVLLGFSTFGMWIFVIILMFAFIWLIATEKILKSRVKNKNALTK